MAKSKKLNLGSTSDFKDSKVSVLLFGESGAGKTTWASTWPNPVFLVPTIAETEMVALAHMDLPMILFDSLNEMTSQVKLLGEAIQRGELVCDTLVIDNLTAIQLMLQQDLKKSSGKTKLEFDEWNIYTATFQSLLTELHKLPPHVIWIAHSEVTQINDKAYGDIFMSGKAVKKIFKAFPSMILEAVVKDMKAAGKKYMIQLKSHDIWTCKIRGPGDVVASFPPQIEADYNNLAELMHWPTREEVEEPEEAKGAAKKKKK